MRVDANAIGSTKCRPSLGSTERLPKGRYLDRLKDKVASEAVGEMKTNEDVSKISFDEWRLDLQFYPLGENNRASGFSLNFFF